MQSFILPANGTATPESITRKRRLAEAMLASGMETGPIGHWSQGAARMAQALAGGLASRKADEQDSALQAESKKEAMARQLLMDQRYNDEQSYTRGRDAKADAMPKFDIQGGQIISVDPRAPLDTAQAQPIPGYASPPGHRLIVGEEAKRMGLPEGAYNMDPEGKISAIGGSDTNVNINNADPNQPMMGTIPPGYAAVRDPSAPSGFRLEMIGGGEAAAAAEMAKQKAAKAEETKAASGDIVSQDIDRAISLLDEPRWLPKTGLGAETLKGYGGTGAANLAGLLSSVEANVGFDALSAMRAASPTGGALGSITERELALLAATKGAITQSQSKEQLKYNLNRLWNVTQDIVHGPNGGPPRRKLGAEQKEANPLKQKYGLE
jgi:hypothetical protein